MSLRVLAHVHQFPPTHNAGAEWMLHDILERLADVHGFECTVITNRPPMRSDRVGPISVHCAPDSRMQTRYWTKADVVMTHLDATGQAMMQQRSMHRPLVHIVHNHEQLYYHKVTEKRCQLVIANSEWIRRVIRWPGESMVVIPPVWAERVLPYGHGRDDGPPPGPHDSVMLLNTNRAKGGDIFMELAASMPDVKFVGVLGAYGHQVKSRLPNVTMVPHTANVAELYAKAAIVLMPSSYESWGRVAVEAAWAHVPTIAGMTPGLRETGVPAVFLPADAAQGLGYVRADWEDAIRGLLDPATNAEVGAAARRRAEELEVLAREQVDALAARLIGLVG